MDQLANINFEAFEVRTANDKNMQKELFNAFIDYSENYKENLLAAVKNSDINLLKSYAHKAKAAMGLFGFEKLYYRFKTIEQNEITDFEILNDEINSIFNELQELLPQLEKYIIINQAK